jgi:hypothetical protein
VRLSLGTVERTQIRSAAQIRATMPGCSISMARPCAYRAVRYGQSVRHGSSARRSRVKVPRSPTCTASAELILESRLLRCAGRVDSRQGVRLIFRAFPTKLRQSPTRFLIF